MQVSQGHCKYVHASLAQPSRAAQPCYGCTQIQHVLRAAGRRRCYRNHQVFIKQPLPRQIALLLFLHDLRRLAYYWWRQQGSVARALLPWMATGSGGGHTCSDPANSAPTDANTKNQPQIIPFFSCTHCLTSNITRAISNSNVATLNAATWLYSLYKISTCRGRVLVKPRIWPDTTDTAPNSPSARAVQSTTPYSRPQRILGRVTCQNICQPDAPSKRAASSSWVPCCCISGISSRATKGTVTNRVASTMPGTAKIIWMPCSPSHSPKKPWAPNSSTYTRPAIIGETEKGRSIRVTSRLLPRNSYLLTHQAAARPNTRFSGTEMPTASRVSLSAAIASGSSMEAKKWL